MATIYALLVEMIRNNVLKYSFYLTQAFFVEGTIIVPLQEVIIEEHI